MEPFRTVTHDRDTQATEVSLLREQVVSLSEHLQMVKESAAMMAVLAADDRGWDRIGQTSTLGDDFTREFLDKAVDFAKNMFIFNPTIKRPVEVQKLYVWALGFTIKSENPTIKQFIDNFLSSPRNKAEFGLDGLKEKEGTLQYSGNLFMAFFTNTVTGEVRVRSIPMKEIRTIYTNPDDSKEPWYYKRALPGATPGQPLQHEWHPDYRYNPIQKQLNLTVDGETWPIRWDVPVYHVKTGGTGEMRWGFPELFSALPWASAYKKFLENWSVIMESYAKVAMQMSRSTNAKDPGAKAKLAAQTPNNQLIGERSGNSNVGQWMLGGVDLKAVKTAGQTTSAEEGRPLSLMVAAGTGLPITFFGDVDVGNFATSTTLDRPTELKFVDRQTSWKSWLGVVFDYAMLQSARAPLGVLRIAGFDFLQVTNTIDNVYEYSIVSPAGQTSSVTLVFPDILERNATERIRALVMGITLMGKKVSNVIPDLRYVTRRMMEAWGESTEMINQLMEEWDNKGLFGDKQPEDINPEDPAPVPFGGGGGGAAQ